MKPAVFLFTLAAAVILSATSAFAHFGMIIPSDSMVMQDDARTLTVTYSFSHPMEMVGMDLAKPAACGVFLNGRRTDLKNQLKPVEVLKRQGWQLAYPVRRPGVHVLFMEPQPYWEPAEDCFIVHYTKTVVAAFGEDEGWDAPIGLKTEIVPLSKPFGQYAGNVFQGVVMMDGKPVPGSMVEVEYYNRDRSKVAPTEYMTTQTVKADPNGVFTYAAPWAGWWGFAALNTSDKTIKKDGEEKEVELGAVIWVEFLDRP